MPQLGTAALSVGFGITLLEKPIRATDPEEAFDGESSPRR